MTEDDGGPRVDRASVIAKLAATFPNYDQDSLLAELDRYGGKGEPERDRVHLAIVKLCAEGVADRPAPLVARAKQDYRDILAAAEYPAQSRVPPGQDPADAAAARAADRAQYRRWIVGRQR